MAREAERLLAGSGWLPEPLRLPEIDAISDEAEGGNGDGELQDIDGDEDAREPGDGNVVNLPAFLNETADDHSRSPLPPNKVHSPPH